ncbi:MAG TPA: ABC transporter permease [Streptosporangiaceae bacterium]
MTMPLPSPVREPSGVVQRLLRALGDIWTTTLRYVLRARSQPDVIIGSVLMPVIFVVLFGYVFGSAIHVPGGHYRTYLMSGLFAQTTLFSSSSVAVAVATDMTEGVIDRFRTLPIARSAVLLGRTISTVIIGLPSLAVMITCALIVGWRPEAGLASAVAGFAMLALFGFAMSWVGALIGMLARSAQAADALSMLPAFVLGFVSNVFVPTAGLPAWLRVVAEWNPLSAVVAAARQMFGTPQGGTAGVWTLQHPVPTTLGMGLVLLAVLIPVTVRRYTRRS